MAPNFRMADFRMIIPGLPSSIASSPATTLAPATPTSKATPEQLPPAAIAPKPMGPPPAQSATPKPKTPSRERVQIEVNTIFREAQEKRAKRTEALYEDTVPESYAGIYSSRKKDRIGCEVPKDIEFRSLPDNVQDDLMRGETPDYVAPQQDLRLRAFVHLSPHDCDEKSHDLQGHMPYLDTWCS